MYSDGQRYRTSDVTTSGEDDAIRTVVGRRCAMRYPSKANVYRISIECGSIGMVEHRTWSLEVTISPTDGDGGWHDRRDGDPEEHRGHPGDTNE